MLAQLFQKPHLFKCGFFIALTRLWYVHFCFTRKSGDCGVRNKLCCFSQRRKVIIYVIFNLKKKLIQASKGIWVNSFARLKTIHIAHQIIIFPLGLCEKKFGLPAPRSQKQTTSHIIHSFNLRFSAWNKLCLFLAKTQSKYLSYF